MNARWNTLVTTPSVGATRIRNVAVYGALLLGLGTAVPPVHAQAPSGRLVSWGSDNYLQVSRTPTGVDFTAVSTCGAFGGFTAALRADGSLASWGSPPGGMPTGTGFVAVAAGFRHGVAIAANGYPVSWGADNFGLISNTPSVPVLAVAAGYDYSVAILSDGSLYTWGNAPGGKPGGTGFKAVAAGMDHCVALRADGSLVSWGQDAYGQVRNTPSGTGFKAVAAGSTFSVALRSDGSLAAWGEDRYGGVSQTPRTKGFIAVAAGYGHALALRSDGSLVSWGETSAGVVSQTPTGKGFKAIAAGYVYSAAIRANQAPVANAGAAQTVTVPHDGSPTTNKTSFTLNGSGSDPDGDSVTYQWKQGSNVLGTTAALTLSRAAGNYTFTLTVTDAWGATTSANVKVTVNPEPNRPPTLSAPASAWCALSGFIFFGASATDPDGDTRTISLVSPSPGSFSPSTNVYTWMPAAPGTYSVTLQATDAYGAATTKTVAITVSALIVENVSLTRSGTTVTVKLNLRKPGSLNATNVQITSATLGGTKTSTALPLAVGTINAGSAKTVSLGFKNVTAGSATLVVNGTSANGLIYASVPVTVP